MISNHELMGGKLHVYKRDESSVWQMSAFVDGRNFRKSTKEESLSHAKEIAEDWFLELKGKFRAGTLRHGKTFKQVADIFMDEYKILTQGERSKEYVDGHDLRLKVHLIPFFGDKLVREVTPGLVQEYRVHRMTSRKHKKTGVVMRPARSTLHHEIITLRHVLKVAQLKGWLEYVPSFTPPYKASGKISHRAWFSPKEYETLYKTTAVLADDPPKKRWSFQYQQLHDFVLFMANTGLRPDEAMNLEFRDVEVVDDPATKKKILEISVRGKRGVGYCKSMPGAVFPFKRLSERKRPVVLGRAQRTQSVGAATPDKKSEEETRLPEPMDRLFPISLRESLNTVLGKLKFKEDREGQRRSAYSLRHTYISLRLMEGADIYQIAKNCRTSVEMIEKFYAAHIKDMINTASVNVVRKRTKVRAKKQPAKAKAARKKRPNGRAPQRLANAKGARNKRKFEYSKGR